MYVATGDPGLSSLLEAVLTRDGTVGRTKAARIKELNQLAKVMHGLPVAVIAFVHFV